MFILFRIEYFMDSEMIAENSILKATIHNNHDNVEEN